MSTLPADPTQTHDVESSVEPSQAPSMFEGEGRIDATIIATVLGGMLLIAAMVAMWMFDTPAHGQFLAMFASVLLGAPIVVDAVQSLISGRHKHHDDEEDVLGQGSHMEELVALAIVAAFANGDYIECGMVAFFMLIASAIEHRTAAGALKAIEGLIRLTPTRAMLINEEGESEVDAAGLKPGDRVLVLPGDNVPGDGVIVAGASALDEANITGESLPVEKQIGDEVFAGTINETGRLEVEISRAGEDSTLGKVQSLILDAAQSKPAAIRELEKYASFYSPAVIMISAILWLFTRDLEASISLLLIACPCAILLCGPTAIVAGLSAAYRLGVMIKSVGDMEVVRRVTAIVFDKTGTLTTGKLEVTRMKPAEGVSPAELLKLAVSLEANSRHPVARAVVAVAQKAKVSPAEVGEFQETAGRGVTGLVEGVRVVVGRESWLKEQQVDMAGVDTAEAEGMSLLMVAKDGRCIGWLGLTDTLRPAAAAAMQDLEDKGVKTRVMITGDRWSPARRVAQQLNLTDVQAEALPGDKLELVEALKDAGHTVAVIGDGVNDGPALAAGHVSIAMGAAGSDVAINAASIALMNNQLDRIPFLIRLSGETVKVIRQNLAGVMVYIIVMLSLLAAGYMTPIFAAIMHGFSSMGVIFNSARLVRRGEDLADAPTVEVETRRTVNVEHVATA